VNLLISAARQGTSDGQRTIAARDTMLQPALTERVVRIVREAGTVFETSPLTEDLTPRERDVLRWIAGGSSNREITAALRMSDGAIKTLS